MSKRYVHIAGPVKGCWEDTAPMLPASLRLRRRDPEQDLGGELMTSTQALNRLVLRDITLQAHNLDVVARSAARLVSKQFHL